MARVTKPLTNIEVKQAKSRSKEYSLSDGQGLMLSIRPSGTKNWLFKYYKPFTKKRTNISFGNYPETSLADARKLRLEARELLAKEVDPKEHKTNLNRQQETAHSNTLKLISKSWLEIKKSQVSPDHAFDIYRSLELHIFPKLGELPVHKLKAPLAIETLTPLSNNGNHDLVKRLAQRLNEIMNYAVNTGLVESNPLSGITKALKAPSKSHYPTIKPEELPEFCVAIDNASIQNNTRALIFWQLHTMVRPSEAAGACWKEIDIENKLWNIPAERMKKKKAHSVPLTKQALSILEHIKPLTSHYEHVFHSPRTKSKHLNESTVNTVLKRHGYKNKLVAHGMRALASTTLNEAGFDPDIIESALAHVDKNEVRAAYNRAEYIEKRRVMMAWWSEKIAPTSTNTSTKPNVVAIRLK
jgi:integrase